MSANPPAPALTIPPALIAAAAGLGPWGLVLVGAVSFGLPFVTHLIGNASNNVPVTPEEWTKLLAKNATSYDDLPGGPKP